MKISSNDPKISLLHATYYRSGGVGEIYEAWVGSSRYPESIEYIVSGDCGDSNLSIDLPLSKIIYGPPNKLWSTAVRNWNSAAELASGSLLFVIADDLFPPKEWDEQLWDMVGDAAKKGLSFALKIRDSSNSTDYWLRHPVVSRRFYERYGLFDKKFHGVYCDNDLTFRAFWKALIVDGRELVFEHRHPSIDSSLTLSESHKRANRSEEFEYGAKVLGQRWSWVRQRVPIHLASPSVLYRGRLLMRVKIVNGRVRAVIIFSAVTLTKVFHRVLRLSTRHHK